MGKARDFFQKITDTKGTFRAKMGTIKDTNGIPFCFKHFLKFVVIHAAKSFNTVNESEVDVFLEFMFFYDPTDVGNLISGSSVISISSLNLWKFTVHVLLKPGLENFEHYFAHV